MMLQNYITEDMVQFVTNVRDWEEAIYTASKPLLEKGFVEERYVQAMVENVKKFGPYIVLMPKVAMPHARPEDGVKRAGISVMITKESVWFDEGKLVNLFFVLAANDASSHLSLLTKISELLSDEEKVEALLAAKSYQHILPLLKGDLS